MKNPVVKLEKALYEHKHSGVFWQRFCHKQVTEAGPWFSHGPGGVEHAYTAFMAGKTPADFLAVV